MRASSRLHSETRRGVSQEHAIMRYARRKLRRSEKGSSNHCSIFTFFALPRPVEAAPEAATAWARGRQRAGGCSGRRWHPSRGAGSPQGREGGV